MKINLVEREFVYHGTMLADPNPKSPSKKFVPSIRRNFRN